MFMCCFAVGFSFIVISCIRIHYNIERLCVMPAQFFLHGFWFRRTVSTVHSNRLSIYPLFFRNLFTSVWTTKWLRVKRQTKVVDIFNTNFLKCERYRTPDLLYCSLNRSEVLFKRTTHTKKTILHHAHVDLHRDIFNSLFRLYSAKKYCEPHAPHLEKR